MIKMFPGIILLGLAWVLRLAVAQDYNVAHAGASGQVISGGNTGNFLGGTPRSSRQGGVFINAGDTFAGVPARVPRGQGDLFVNAGVPVGLGNPSFPAVSGQSTGFPAAPVQVGAINSFPGQSGQGFFSLPTQQGQGFLGGQGGSFVGGSSSVFGQGGDSGFGIQQAGLQAGAAQGAGFFGGVQGGAFLTSSIVHQQITPTVTRTITVDAFETLTDLVLVSEPVTLTQFSLITSTRVTLVVVPTPVNDVVSLSTSVVVSPTFVTLTETKSDFRVVVRTSVKHITLTHTVYSITHVPFTITDTETVRITSPVVSTIIRTSVEAVTNYRTVTDVAYVHGGYY